MLSHPLSTTCSLFSSVLIRKAAGKRIYSNNGNKTFAVVFEDVKKVAIKMMINSIISNADKNAVIWLLTATLLKFAIS